MEFHWIITLQAPMARGGTTQATYSGVSEVPPGARRSTEFEKIYGKTAKRLAAGAVELGGRPNVLFFDLRPERMED